MQDFGTQLAHLYLTTLMKYSLMISFSSKDLTKIYLRIQ